MRRIKLVLAMATVLVGMLALQAGPALADDDGCIGPRADNGNCIGVEEDRGHHDWNDSDWDDCDWDYADFDNHDLFINDFDDYEDFTELDDCEFVGWDGDEAIYVCELDF